MLVAFTPWNPFSWWLGHVPSRPVFPAQPKVPAGTPINVSIRSSDPGIQLTRSTNSITLRGTTAGPRFVPEGGYDVSRGLSVTLDIDKAPTVDVFGATNYTEKNDRLFGLSTQRGWSAAKCAQLLAAKVNSKDDFRATVSVAADGAATVRFTRR